MVESQGSEHSKFHNELENCQSLKTQLEQRVQDVESDLQVDSFILILLLTLSGLASQKTRRGCLELSGLVCEEAHAIVSLILLNLPLKALMLEAPTAYRSICRKILLTN